VNDLVPLYREMAADGANFHGLSILQHSKQIGKLIKECDAQTVLDFGAGRGDAYNSPHKVYRDWGLKRHQVTLYDPAFPKHDKLPSRKFDFVVCSDVLEHVPEADVDVFIHNLFKLAKHGVWASVCCRPAKKTFPQNGENLHVTLHPLQWWHDTFAEFAAGMPFTLVETP
jgi:hypothetical protein